MGDFETLLDDAIGHRCAPTRAKALAYVAALEQKVADLRSIANVNGDWTAKVAQLQDDLAFQAASIAALLPYQDEAIRLRLATSRPGWKWVPVEPTTEMIQAIRNGYGWVQAYKDCIAASPEPPALAAPGGGS